VPKLRWASFCRPRLSRPVLGSGLGWPRVCLDCHVLGWSGLGWPGAVRAWHVLGWPVLAFAGLFRAGICRDGLLIQGLPALDRPVWAWLGSPEPGSFGTGSAALAWPYMGLNWCW
jgi:hypothetical protein